MAKTVRPLETRTLNFHSATKGIVNSVMVDVSKLRLSDNPRNEQLEIVPERGDFLPSQTLIPIPYTMLPDFIELLQTYLYERNEDSNPV
jgi:hypothetical protein